MFGRLRLVSLAIGCSVLALAAPLAASSPSHAAGGTPNPPGVQYSIPDLFTYTGQTLYEMGALGSCTNPGGTCTITVSTSKSTTIQTALSASKDWIGGQIGLSYGTSTSISTSCTSRKLSSGEVFTAYPRGTEKMYRVRRQQGGNVDTSSWLFARKPDRNSIACYVS
jgi:hypothetical protein